MRCSWILTYCMTAVAILWFAAVWGCSIFVYTKLYGGIWVSILLVLHCTAAFLAAPWMYIMEMGWRGAFRFVWRVIRSVRNPYYFWMLIYLLHTCAVLLASVIYIPTSSLLGSTWTGAWIKALPPEKLAHIAWMKTQFIPFVIYWGTLLFLWPALCHVSLYCGSLSWEFQFFPHLSCVLQILSASAAMLAFLIIAVVFMQCIYV